MYKLVLIIIFVSLSLTSIAADRKVICDTVPTGVPQLFGGKYYKFNGYALIDSFIMTAPGDTNAIPYFPSLEFKSSDNRWYGSDRSRWQKFLFPGDTVSLSNRINLKLNLTDTAQMLSSYINLTGYGIARNGQAIRADTSELVTQYDLTLVAPANNGISKNGDTIQIGQSIGASGDPGILSNNREIPLNGFGLTLRGKEAQEGSYLIFKRPDTTTSTLQEYTTYNGDVHGNYYMTLDGTHLNPDGQRDAVLHFGYNISGTGGRRIPSQPSIHDAWESHFDDGSGDEQMERHIEFSVPTGENSRLISWQAKTTAPLRALMQIRSDEFGFRSTDDSKGLFFFNENGNFQMSGDEPNAFLRINNNTYSSNVQIQPVNGSTVMSATGAGFNFVTPAIFTTTEHGGLATFFNDVNSTTQLALFRNNNSGANAEANCYFTNNSGNTILGLTSSAHAAPNAFYIENQINGGSIIFAVTGVRNMVMTGDGKTGFSVNTPTALLHIAAGTATANTAPLKFTTGTNLTTPENGAVEYDGTNYFVTASTTRYTLAKTLTNTATLDFSSTAAGNSADLTVTVTGAAVGDAVSIGLPGSPDANSCVTAWVSASDTVTVRFNNYSSGAIDPGSGSYRVSVIKY